MADCGQRLLLFLRIAYGEAPSAFADCGLRLASVASLRIAPFANG
jgi:hypothetical protein